MDTEMTYLLHTHTHTALRCAESTDSDLISEYARSKCESSFNELHSRHDKKLRSFLSKRFGLRADDRDELSQQIWLCILKKLSAFDIDRPFAPWLLGIAKKHAIRFRGRRDRDQARFGDDMPEDVQDRHLSDLTDKALRDDESQHLKEVIDSLLTTQSLAVYAVYYEGLSISEAAIQFGIAPRSMNSRLSRARREIKAILA